MGVFSPTLQGGDLVLARLPNSADGSSTQQAQRGAHVDGHVVEVATLAVEPTFLSEVARAVVASADRDISRLRDRAAGNDGRFFWGSKRGETLLLRRGPHGD